MSYSKDPVVEEIRETRRKIFKEFDNDPYKFGKFLAERQEMRNSKPSRLKGTSTKSK
ncbi:MAG: hypothetical protein GXY77_06660 [Fibrobacter sp.]|nr:hypothetical protein [Fibrobacter sp.]